MPMDADALEASLLERHAPHLVCRPDSDLVIEGYPRSANTFTVDMISVLSGSAQLRIGHHTHAVENLQLGALYGKPLLVLIRNPADAILSFKIFSGHPTPVCVEKYREFYQTVLSLDAFIVARFEDVTNDFNSVLKDLNTHYGMAIAPSTDLPADISKARSLGAARASKVHRENAIRRSGAPTPERDALKDAARADVIEAVRANPDLSDLYEAVLAKGASLCAVH